MLRPGITRDLKLIERKRSLPSAHSPKRSMQRRVRSKSRLRKDSSLNPRAEHLSLRERFSLRAERPRRSKHNHALQHLWKSLAIFAVVARLRYLRVNSHGQMVMLRALWNVPSKLARQIRCSPQKVRLT
jgi:hypothetical protein